MTFLPRPRMSGSKFFPTASSVVPRERFPWIDDPVEATKPAEKAKPIEKAKPPPEPIHVVEVVPDFDEPRDQTMYQICSEVAKKHGISVKELRGPSRRGGMVEARHEAMWRCRRELELSLPIIGRFFGRDHASIVYGVMRHEERDGDSA